MKFDPWGQVRKPIGGAAGIDGQRHCVQFEDRYESAQRGGMCGDHC